MKADKYSPEEIWEMDADTWTIGNDELRHLVSISLSKIPAAVVDKVRKGCLFNSLSEEAGGEILSPDIIKNHYLINIHSIILNGEREKAIRVILHEVAHYYLKQQHLLADLKLTSEQYEMQEKEADKLVEFWLK